MAQWSTWHEINYCAGIMEDYHITVHCTGMEMKHCENTVEYFDDKNGVLGWHKALL